LRRQRWCGYYYQPQAAPEAACVAGVFSGVEGQPLAVPAAAAPGTQFTSFNGTQVQILTQQALAAPAAAADTQFASFTATKVQIPPHHVLSVLALLLHMYKCWLAQQALATLRQQKVHTGAPAGGVASRKSRRVLSLLALLVQKYKH
jgi:hypothetical protein